MPGTSPPAQAKAAGPGPARGRLYPSALATVPPAAALVWFAFAGRPDGFWLPMAAATAALGVAAVVWRRALPVSGGGKGLAGEGLRQGDFALGFAAAAALYGLFWAGTAVLPAIWPGLPAAILGLYRSTAVGPWQLRALLLVLVIAPGEELYWRGLVQRALQERLPAGAAVGGAALLYGATHLLAAGPVLGLAALVAGLGWGWLYRWQGRLAPVIISHVLWDLAVLLFLPLR